MWRSVFVSADMPVEILNYLDEKLTEICTSDDFAEHTCALSETPAHVSMEEYNKNYQEEIGLYDPILKSLGLA